jgi:CRISPR system Cascade subunit CasD
MSTLLLRLSGPMQSWGTQSRFRERDTGLEPSKSGVIGMLCAALGRSRHEPVDDLAALRMAVRVDREGVMRVDYHTTGGDQRSGSRYGVVLPDGKKWTTVLSNRYYLADADFLVGLEGDHDLLGIVDDALRWPRTQLFFGRKSFPPGAPVRLPDEQPWGPGLSDEPLQKVLRAVPWLGHLDPPGRRKTPERLRLVLESNGAPTPDLRQDVPISYAERLFSSRYVVTEWIDTPSREGDS